MEKMGARGSYILNMAKIRDKSLDNLGGLLIIYMILGHAVALTSNVSPSETVRFYYDQCTSVFFFYMPWFFFKSGMLTREEDIQVVISKCKKKLVVPWVKWSIISFFIGSIISIIHQDFVRYVLYNGYELLVFGAVHANMPLWFLLTLCIVKVGYIWLRKWNINPILIIFCSLFLSFVLSYIPNCRPSYIPNSLLALFFFTVGNMISNNSLFKSAKLIILLAFAYIYYLIPSLVDFRTNTLLNGYYFLYCLFSLFAIWGWNSVFYNVKFLNKGGAISYIGENSLFFYCAHWPVLLILIELYKHVFKGGTLFIWCFCTLFIVLYSVHIFVQKKAVKI